MSILLLLFGCHLGPSGDLRIDTAFVIDDTGFVEAEPTYCLSEEERQTMENWLYQTWLVAYGAPAVASPSTVASFYQLPGIEASPWFQFNLAAPCDAPHDLDPVCSNHVCYQVECTGQGGSWVNHIENDGDIADDDVTDFGGWTLERGRLPLTWIEGTTALALELDVKSLLDPTGKDWTVVGTAILDGQLDLSASFPRLYENAGIDIEITDDVGEVAVDGEPIATWSGQTLTPTEGCAPE